MRYPRLIVCLSICAFLLTGFAAARHNKFGVADKYTVTLSGPTRVGSALLPSGEYEVRHTMKGEEHIMVFRQVGARSPIEVSVKCVLVQLPRKAARTEQIYLLNAANERVLHELIFQGDTAKHVF